MSLLARVVLFIMTFFFTNALLYGYGPRFLDQSDPSTFDWTVHLGGFAFSLVVALLVWFRLESDGESPDRNGSMLIGAVVLGFIGFYAGFLGPMILTPDSNQGPFLGILITGPLGFAVGGGLGRAYWELWGRYNAEADDDTGS